MNMRLLEKIKTYTVLTLIITSLIQAGILWEYHNHGLPFNFLAVFFGSNDQKQQDALQSTKAEYFVPYRIIASEGYDGTYWVLDKKNDDYLKLWSEAKYYLKTIVGSDKPESVPTIIAKEKWSELLRNTSFIYEFKTELKQNILTWFLDMPKASQNHTNLYKMLIVPEEDINDSINTIYILDDKAIYKYVIRMNPKGFTKASYDNILDRLSKDSSMKTYNIAKYLFPKNPPFPIREDMFFITSGNKGKFSEIKSILSNPPKVLKLKDLNEKAREILGDEECSYDISQGTTAIEMKNLNNVFKLYADGLLEYKFLPTTEDMDNGNVEKALENTLGFINKLEHLTSGAEIYLSGIKELSGGKVFEFTFDYGLDGIFTFTDVDHESFEGRKLKNSITITASSKQVLNCLWILKSFEYEKENKYSVNFMDLLDKVPEVIGENNYRAFSLKDVSIAYKIEPSLKTEKVNPAWVITKMNDEQFTVEMH